MHLLPEGTCYLSTRIVYLDFRGWGVDRADCVHVAVCNWGEIGGKTVVHFAIVPATASVVKDDDTFFICFFHGFVSEDGWGEERELENHPWFSSVFGKLMSKFCS